MLQPIRASLVRCARSTAARRPCPSSPASGQAPGARMPLLTEVFDLVNRYHAHQVWMNIETKVEAGAPQETAPREQFVQVVARQVLQAGVLNQVTIQSFDWGALMRMRQVEPPTTPQR
jgi:glycerophosphoryl diester phosphodiesterase